MIAGRGRIPKRGRPSFVAETQQVAIVFSASHYRIISDRATRSQFSKEWLGREESYHRSIQSKGLKPSVEAQLNLVSRLRALGMSFSRSEYPTLVKFGNTYLKLYGEFLEAMLNPAQSDAVKLDCEDDRVQR
jgi:hypothetical protein